jgi:hypothetical protein
LHQYDTGILKDIFNIILCRWPKRKCFCSVVG